MNDFMLKSREKIVLIGDSITDCGRRNDFPPLGNGYVYIAHNLAVAKYPERDILWVNKGIGGDTVQGLVERWTRDVIDEKPDWVSIYIGINNAARDKLSNKILKNFEESYRKILNRTVKEINSKIIMFEIFYIASEDPNKRNINISPYNHIIHSLAEEYEAILVPIDSAFKEAVNKRPSSQWTMGDGVHPTPIGHTLIALKFLEALRW